MYKPYPCDANDERENLNSSGDRVLHGGISKITRLQFDSVQALLHGRVIYLPGG